MHNKVHSVSIVVPSESFKDFKINCNVTPYSIVFNGATDMELRNSLTALTLSGSSSIRERKMDISVNTSSTIFSFPIP